MRRAIILGLTLLTLASCAHWKASSTAGYESAGAILASIGNRAKSMCAANAISPADCAVLKVGYSKARAAYITAGDALIAAINTRDGIQKRNDLAGYQKAISDFSALLPELIKTADVCGIVNGNPETLAPRVKKEAKQ